MAAALPWQRVPAGGDGWGLGCGKMLLLTFFACFGGSRRPSAGDAAARAVLPLFSPGAIRDKDVTRHPPPWEGVPRLAAVPWRPWHATGHHIGGIKGENLTSSLRHIGLLLPRRLPVVALCSVPARPRRPATDHPPARFLAVMGSQQSDATSNASQPVSHSAHQVQLAAGAGRGGIAALAVAPRTPRWLGGKATQGGANPPGVLRTAGKGFEPNLAAWCCPPSFTLVLWAQPFRGLCGTGGAEGFGEGRLAIRTHFVPF